MDLDPYTNNPSRHNPNRHITEDTEAFRSFFQVFSQNLTYFLNSGDVVIVLLVTPASVSGSNFTRNRQSVSSTKWLNTLSILNDWKMQSQERPTVTSDIDSLNSYFQAVSRHYALDVNSDVVRNPEVLASINDGATPTAIAVNEFIDDAGLKKVSGGILILLPQPKTITKSHRLVEQLVDLGWAYHANERPTQEPETHSPQSLQLSMPLNQFDDELIEYCLLMYKRGDYSDAAAKACKILENRVKQLVGDEIEYKSTADLMKKAFRPSEGLLSMGEEAAEERGAMFLYAGAIQGLRNPLAHRLLDPENERYLDDFDQQKAHDVICFVNLLLSFLDDSTAEEQN